jgi:hypothetical protein
VVVFVSCETIVNNIHFYIRELSHEDTLFILLLFLVMNNSLFICYSINNSIKSEVIAYSQKIDWLLWFLALRSTIAILKGIDTPEDIVIINFFRLNA